MKKLDPHQKYYHKWKIYLIKLQLHHISVTSYISNPPYWLVQQNTSVYHCGVRKLYMCGENFSKLHAKNYSSQPCAFFKFRNIPEKTAAVEFLFYRSRHSQVLCWIPALNSFLENLQEDMQVYLIRTPP